MAHKATLYFFFITTKNMNKNTNTQTADKTLMTEKRAIGAIIDKPFEFAVEYKKSVRKPFFLALFSKEKHKEVVKERKFTITPPTIGKMNMLSGCFLAMNIDEDALSKEPIKEAMRVCEENGDMVCRMMAISVLSRKEDLMDEEKINELIDFFKWNSNPTDYSAIVLILLSQIDYVNFINSIRLTRTLRLSSPITEGRKPNMPKKNARETKMARTQLIEM